MNTVLLSTEPDDIEQASAYLRAGEVLVFPTDTVYGIGVDAFNAQALASLYRVKQRPLNKGIPILISDNDVLAQVAVDVPPIAFDLIARFWPGPLTLLLTKHPSVPVAISPNGKIAVRVPKQSHLRQLIRQAGGAVATSSANRSGREPALTAQAAFEQFRGEIAAVIDDGVSPYRMASTILDCTTTPWRVLRDGPIARPALGLEVA